MNTVHYSAEQRQLTLFFLTLLSSNVECNTIQFNWAGKTKGVWLYDEPKIFIITLVCLHVVPNYEVRSTENVIRTWGDEVALNANAACCGGPQSLKRLAVSSLYANMGTRGQVQIRLPNLTPLGWSEYGQYRVGFRIGYTFIRNNQCNTVRRRFCC